jgi:hypothetical protein
MVGIDKRKLARIPKPREIKRTKANELSNFQNKKLTVTAMEFWSAKKTAIIAITKATIKNS